VQVKWWFGVNVGQHLPVDVVPTSSQVEQLLSATATATCATGNSAELMNGDDAVNNKQT